MPKKADTNAFHEIAVSCVSDGGGSRYMVAPAKGAYNISSRIGRTGPVRVRAAAFAGRGGFDAALNWSAEFAPEIYRQHLSMIAAGFPERIHDEKLMRIVFTNGSPDAAALLRREPPAIFHDDCRDAIALSADSSGGDGLRDLYISQKWESRFSVFTPRKTDEVDPPLVHDVKCPHECYAYVEEAAAQCYLFPVEIDHLVDPASFEIEALASRANAQSIAEAEAVAELPKYVIPFA